MASSVTLRHTHLDERIVTGAIERDERSEFATRMSAQDRQFLEDQGLLVWVDVAEGLVKEHFGAIRNCNGRVVRSSESDDWWLEVDFNAPGDLAAALTAYDRFVDASIDRIPWRHNDRIRLVFAPDLKADMDPRDLNALAKRLAGESGPGESRTAINRAYYAAFNYAVEVLVQWGCTFPSTAECHREVRETLANSTDPSLQRSSKRLSDLYSWRERADYQMADVWSESQTNANAAVNIASNVITAIESVKTGPDAVRKAVETAVQKWNTRPGRSFR
jgi:hypothetical protein